VHSNNNTVGIYCRAYRSYLTVEVTSNEVYNSSTGIYCHGYGYNSSYVYDGLISGNTVYDNTGTGISCYEEYVGQFYPEIRGNTVTTNGGDGISRRTATRWRR